MGKKLAIRGHSTRGKEVIELLEMMGGINDEGYIGTNTWKDEYYSLDNGYIRAYDWCDDIKFTLEEFLYKYPFKVGDTVFLYDNITDGYVTGMKWDENTGTVKYCVYTSGECWCDVEELLKWNYVDLVERHHRDNIEEVQSTHANSILIMEHSMQPIVKDGFLEYKIVDGYEFDKVENGNIILKPIKPKYPKTYEECCEVLDFCGDYFFTTNDADCVIYKKEVCGIFQQVNPLIQLLICRSAYWKIAGEELGLGKPWEPNWTTFEGMPGIFRFRYNIVCGSIKDYHCLLVFPTDEMRDSFYENFKNLIEQCKELL